MESGEFSLNRDSVSKCLLNNNNLNDGHNAIPRVKNISPPGTKTKDLTSKIALYDDFTSKYSRVSSPNLKRTVDSLIHARRKVPVITDGLVKHQIASEKVKKGTLVSEIGKNFENSSLAVGNNTSKSPGNVLTSRKENTTLLLEHSAECQSGVNKNESNTCLSKQFPCSKINQVSNSNGRHIIDVNINQVFDKKQKVCSPDVKLDVGHRCNSENIQTKLSLEHLTNGVCNDDSRAGNTDDNENIEITGKCLMKSQTTQNDIHITGNIIDDKKKPTKSPSSLQIKPHVEINYYDSENRPARISPVPKNYKAGMTNVIQNVSKHLDNNNNDTSSKPLSCNGKIGALNENEINNQHLNKKKNTVYGKKESISPKLKQMLQRNRQFTADGAVTRPENPMLKNRNYEMIFNDIKDEKHVKVSNFENMMGMRCTKENMINNLNGYEDLCSEITDKSGEKLKNEKESCNVNYQKMRHNFDNEEESKTVEVISNGEKNGRHVQVQEISIANSQKNEKYVRSRDRSRRRNINSDDENGITNNNKKSVKMNSENCNSIPKLYNGYENMKELFNADLPETSEQDQVQEKANVTVGSETEFSKVNYKKMRHNFDNAEEHKSGEVVDNDYINGNDIEEDGACVNHTSSQKLGNYVRIRDRRRRRNTTGSSGSDALDNDKPGKMCSDDESTMQEVYRRSRRSPDDGHRIKRYRSTDKLFLIDGTDSTLIHRRSREGDARRTSPMTKKENTSPSNLNSIRDDGNSSKNNGNRKNNNTQADISSCGNEVSMNKLQKGKLQNGKKLSNFDVFQNGQSVSCDSKPTNCYCGTDGTDNRPASAFTRRKRRNKASHDLHEHRQSFNGVSYKNNKDDKSSSQKASTQIQRTYSKSDPSLLSSSFQNGYNPDNFISSDLRSPQNGYNHENFTSSDLRNENLDEGCGKSIASCNGDVVVSRKRTTAAADSKHRHHSTGHSPDITTLLQHLICDIEEEEIINRCEDETKKIDEQFKLAQLEAFNSELSKLITSSVDAIDMCGVTTPYKSMRRTLSEDDIGLQLLRKQRLKRKSNSGELPLTRKPSVIWAIVKKMEVSLVIQRDYGDPDVIKIEDFNVRRVNTYKDVEELAVDTFMKHLQLLDKQHLNLDTYDIKYLQMAEHRVPLGSPFDLSLVKVDDAFLPCRLCMKDKESWSLASLSYDSLIPKSYLEKYLSLILSHHHGVFFGPSGTGKSYLAERISNLINYRMNEGTIPPIILKNATPERWKTLLSNLCTDKKEKPFVIILDGFSQRFIESNIDIGDIIKVCDKLDPKPYIICTLTITPYIEIPPKWQLNFKWIWLSNHEEPVDGLLQRYLRRKFIQFGNQHLQREFFRIADWLTSVWRHINSFLKKFTSSDCSIGPTMFYECPSDILEAEEWFVDLWNYSITPYILTTVKEGLKLHSTRSEWEDPLAFILKSYPWVSEKMKRKMKLKRICKEDVDYSMHCHSEEEKQRLLDFLRQLEIMMFANVDQRKETVSKRYTLESFL